MTCTVVGRIVLALERFKVPSNLRLMLSLGVGNDQSVGLSGFRDTARAAAVSNCIFLVPSFILVGRTDRTSILPLGKHKKRSEAQSCQILMWQP